MHHKFIRSKLLKIEGTGKEQHITITSSTNMSQEDIDKAVRDAEKFAEEDKKQKEAVEVKNKAETMIYQSEKSLSDIGDKVSEDDKAPVRAAIETLKETLKGSNIDAIKADTEALEKAFYPIAEKMYAAQQDPNMGGQQYDAGAGSADGNTYYSADFEDKSDN